MECYLLNGLSPWRILNAFLAGSRTVSPRSKTPSFRKHDQPPQRSVLEASGHLQCQRRKLEAVAAAKWICTCGLSVQISNCG